jgi:hypothetical protein
MCVEWNAWSLKERQRTCNLQTLLTQKQKPYIEAPNHKATVGGASTKMMADVNRYCVREQPFSTGENRRSHQLAPFVRQKPGSMSVIAIFRQQPF